MKFTLNRKYCLVSLAGHAIQFEKDVPVDVPNHIAHEAVAIGAVPVEGDVGEDGKVEIKTALEADPLKRAAEIKAAMKIIVEKAQRSDFTAGGRPHLKAITKVVGFEVDNAERDKVWEALQAEEAGS